MSRLNVRVHAATVLLVAAIACCPAASALAAGAAEDLIFAASDDDLPRVKALPLIDARADVNAKAGNGATASYIASQRRHHDVVEMLGEAGAKD